MMPYVITEAAADDMEEIFFTIAPDNPKAALALESDFYEAFQMLSEHPYAGRLRPDLTGENCFFWSVRRRYLVIYDAGTPLTIIRVASTYRNIALLLQES